MDWVNVLLVIQQMSPIEAVMATVMILYFSYKGGLVLFPFLKNKKISKTLINIHKSCPNFTSLEIILEKVMEKSDKIYRIKYQDTLYEQMNEAELMWDTIKEVLKNNFIKTFDSSFSDKEDRELSINYYEMIIDNMETEMLGLIRRWMRKNHFIEKNGIEYEAYIVEKIQQLYNKMTRLFDTKYNIVILKLNKDYLRNEMNINCMPNIRTKIHSFFLKARSIAEIKAKEIEKIEMEIKGL